MNPWSDYLDSYGRATDSPLADFYDTSFQTDSQYEPSGINGGIINAGSEISVGSGDAISVMSGSDPTYRLWIGSAEPNSAPFSVDRYGHLVANSITISGYVAVGGAASDVNSHAVTISGGKITANSITATQINSSYIYTNTVVATQITSGTLLVGTGGAGQIYILHTAPKSGLLIWQGGSTIWEDSSNYLGLWSIGGYMYLWCGNANDARLLLTPHGNQNQMHGGLAIYNDQDGNGNLNVDGDAQVNGTIKTNDNKMQFQASGGGQYFSLRNAGLTSSIDGSNQPHLYWGNGTGVAFSHAGNNWFLNGNAKTAVVPTYEGYKALYCAESPEVWFFDFAKDKNSIDPLFLDVTDGDMKTLKTEEGDIMVFRRRKGYANVRFEPKTLEEFDRNNWFWGQAKIDSSVNKE
jgi:hypothetical protein